MPNRAAEAPVPVEAPAEPIPDTARAELARHIDAKTRSIADAATVAAKLDRARDVLHRALGDEAEAERLLKAIQAQSLMQDEEGWRDNPAVIKAEAGLKDAQERIPLAQLVIAELEEERGRLNDAARRAERMIGTAVSAVIRSSPDVQALIAHAFHTRRVLRQLEIIMEDTLRQHFPNRKIPGWNVTALFDTPPRSNIDWDHAVQTLQRDASTPFPACPE